MNLTDTHCHLNLDAFEDDLDLVINHAQEAGVKKILVPGIDIQTSIKAVEISEAYEFIFAAVGVHPNSAKTWDSNAEKAIRDLADHPKVVAIGEIGLDFYRQKASVEQQKTILNIQLKIAQEFELPIVIHNRESSDELFPILIAWQQNLKTNSNPVHERTGVLHAFNTQDHYLQALIEANYMFGLGGPVTYKNNRQLSELVKQLPLERLLLETDAPFLTPHPKRGQRNVPAYTSFIAQKISELKNVGLSNFLESTYQNANRLFCWSKL